MLRPGTARSDVNVLHPWNIIRIKHNMPLLTDAEIEAHNKDATRAEQKRVWEAIVSASRC